MRFNERLHQRWLSGKMTTVVIVCLLISVFPLPQYEALIYDQGTVLSTVDASIYGEGQSDRFGGASALVGDVNGDGFEDLLIGAPRNDRGGTESGQTYLFFGPGTDWTMNMPASNANASFVGEAPDDYSGSDVSGVGDVNGDGFDDFIIAAPQYWNSPIQTTSKAYLYFGKASGWSMYQDLEDANVIYKCPKNRQGQADISVGGGGDVNGDGFDDFVIGCPFEEEKKSSGRVNIILGKATGWPDQLDLSDHDVSFYKPDATYSVGREVANIGDVNGDNYDDIAMNNYVVDYPVLIIYGRPSGWTKEMDLTDSDTMMIRANETDTVIKSIASAGDVNGDGIGDLILGSPTNSEIDFFSGKGYLIFGKKGGWGPRFNLTYANATFLGNVSSQSLGWSVSGAGDVNGDGYDDFMISESMPSWGKVYLYLGSPNGWTQRMNLTTSNASFIGNNILQQPGSSLAGGGDLDIDGYDDIVIGEYIRNDVFIAYPDHNIGPSSITSLKAYTDASYTTEKTTAKLGDRVFVEITGPGGNVTRADITMISVESTNDKPGFYVRLVETGPDTGVFRGALRVMNRTNEDYGWVQAFPGDDVTMISFTDNTKKIVLPVVGVLLRPITDLGVIFEDTEYMMNYTSIGDPVTQWSFGSNASWLSWDGNAHRLSGIPDNRDVGSYWARINITDGQGNFDEHNFTVRVVNVPPDILTKNKVFVDEGTEYLVDYSSTDDGQGTITWALRSNTSWLDLDGSTGILNGTPDDPDLGKWWVNVSVDDGNGGSDWTNFTLTVNNTNDRPMILITDVLYATEDIEYSVQYNATDLDKGDSLTWNLVTNASSWLHLDRATGLLSGIPINDDVGAHWVNISVRDGSLAEDHHNFTLVVNNSNDAPFITSSDKLKAYEASPYQVTYKAADIDIMDQLTWSMSTNASSWLGLNLTSDTAVLNGTPENDDVGIYWVNISVSDLAGSQDHHNFTLTVINVNDLPVITSLPPTLVNISQQYIYQVVAEDIDIGDMLNYSLLQSPDGMLINSTGAIRWTPNKGQAGTHKVTIKVDDGLAEVLQSYNITVISPNHRPRIDLIENISIKVGDTFERTVVAHDDDGDALTFELVSYPTGMTLSDTGFIQWNPTKEQVGNHTVSVKVSDGKANASNATLEFTITVTKQPTATPTATAGSPWWLALVVIVIIAVVIVVMLLVWKKKKDGAPSTAPNQHGQETDPGANPAPRTPIQDNISPMEPRRIWTNSLSLTPT